MRVIAGTYRGRRLFSPDNMDIRPTSDRAKEAIFNIIQWDIEGKVFLDLFAGSGGIGIEAISRGAQKVFFSDTDTKLVNKNLKGIEGDFLVKEIDYKRMLTFIKDLGIKVDIIYADPPYKMVKDNPTEIIDAVFASGILKRDGQLIIEHGSDVALKSDSLSLFDTRKYGIAVIDRFRYKKRGLVTGTFDPFTKGHLYVVENALKQVDNLDIVIFDNPDKTPRYSVEKRIEIIKNSIKFLDTAKINIGYSGGFVADYCKEHSIDLIFRGARNNEEIVYEQDMAAYNKAHAGVETVIFEAEDKFISSTETKLRLDQNKDLSLYIADGIEKILKEDN